MTKPHKNIAKLREFQRWRRGAEIPHPAPAEVSKLIDWAIAVCEAAELTLKDNGHLADGDQCTLKALRVALTGE